MTPCPRGTNAPIPRAPRAPKPQGLRPRSPKASKPQGPHIYIYIYIYKLSQTGPARRWLGGPGWGTAALAAATIVVLHS